MPTKIRQDQADALGPEACASCAAAAKALKVKDAGKSVVIADKKKKLWVAIELLDEDNQPVAREAYIVRVPGGAEVKGELDSKGKARVEGIDPGDCTVSFPNLGQGTWVGA